MSMDIYSAMATPPQTALKKITGGRLSGMTDIRPQWRYRIMTETFGLCGVGWRYTIERQWTEEAPTGEVMAFVNVHLYVKANGEWSEPIPGTGGSMLVAKEKSGMHASDEAYKMATTDALSVAMKMIGVAASIYEGHDVSKYDPPPAKSPGPVHDYSRMPAEGMDAALLPRAIKQEIARVEDATIADAYREDAKAAYGLTDAGAKEKTYRTLLADIRRHNREVVEPDTQEPVLPDSQGEDLF